VRQRICRSDGQLDLFLCHQSRHIGPDAEGMEGVVPVADAGKPSVALDTPQAVLDASADAGYVRRSVGFGWEWLKRIDLP
jgi:hypothetical protein